MTGLLLALELVVLAPEVQTLNQQGETALAERRYDDAARYFRAALALQPQNLSWLGLGEALLNLGACTEADEAFAAVATAPETPDSPTEVAAPLAAGLRRSLEDRCPGRLRVRCPADGPATYQIDGAAEVACNEAVELRPGPHRVSSKDGTEISFDIRGLRTTELSLGGPRSVPAPAIAVVDPLPPPPDHTLAWVLAGSGAAVAVLGAGLHLGGAAPARDDALAMRRAFADGRATAAQVDARDADFERWRAASLAAYAGAALLLTSGVTVWIWE